ncbi:MAG: M36 family metallopeptidase [Pyrinomonadaceae bacterium]|nr:M36 family metallopeptidase [Pyrinomonadaceae bacterium]
MKTSKKIVRAYLTAAICAFMILVVPSNTFGIVNLFDTAQGLPDIDNRVGVIAPTTAQLSLVNNIGGRADWNKFGTINTLVKDGGFLATGLTGEPVDAAREYIRANRDLFKLSEQSVANLVLVNDAKMPYNNAHYVLFRQRFGTYTPTQDGQINVSIVDGKVFHVWSSSAGDETLSGQAVLTPAQAWLAAATNVNLPVPVSSILSSAVDQNNNWTLLDVVGFKQKQQVRLTALPTPGGIARLSYEVNVINVNGHISNAYTVFVDAQSGNILYRTNRVNFLVAPATTTFQGAYTPMVFPCSATDHFFTVPAGRARIAVQVTAAVASNDLKVHLLLNGAIIQEEDTGTSSEALNYAPAGGVPPGNYQVKICQTPNTMDVPQMAPFNYVGTFTTDDTATPSTSVPLPRWKYHLANPDLDFVNTDLLRVTGCWESSAGFPSTPVPGCQRGERNVAARAPWDYDFNAGTFTGTTRGNAAQTAESWGSPLTPSTPYSPTSATRDYSYKWSNHWNRTKCDPTIFTHSAGVMDDADIDASIVQLFVTHNRFHNWSYYLGFTESNYNMQLDNFGNTDATRENDPEVGNVQAGAISGGANGMYLGRDNANQITLQDGTPGITNQYLFQPIAAAFYAPCTDGDIDVGIVGHEYTHAVSNRMVAGPDAGLSGAQATSMGESWSDLDAAEYINAYNYAPTNDENPTAVGIYATNNRRLAIRDYNMEDNPLNFGNFAFDTPGAEVHSDGEIWNAVNWDIRQILIEKYNAQYPYSDLAARRECADGKKNPADCAGNRRWVQLMFDSFLLQPAATSMLNARDAELSADMARFGGANQVEMWRVFARRGMGILANANGSGDVSPVPDFSSPLENNANVTFNVTAKDESNVTINGARIFVGKYEGRVRPIADLDPATTVSGDPRTNINDNVAKFVGGTYDFVVQAPGYGAHSFTKTFLPGETSALTFSLPTNRASLTKGAAVTTTATVPADQTAKDTLIDDTEGTGARLGTVGPVSGHSMTIDLQGTTPVNVTNVNVSTAAGPTNPGRFTGVRKFEILACNKATCLLPTDFTVVYTSPNDAFPAEVPRPVQPQLIMRNFDIPDTMATQLKLRVVTTQCTGTPDFLGEQDNDPFNNTDCAASPNGIISRATEFQAFSSAPTVSAPTRLECDVFSRSNGDGFVDSLDVGQIQRFQLGLDPIMPNEFQAADCSLFGTLGDGFMDSLDVGQARRYQAGLDPLQIVGGPLTARAFADTSTPNKISREKVSVKSKSNVRVVSQKVAAGQTIPVAIETNSTGKESIYGFTLSYDREVLTYVPGSIKIGSGASRQGGGECNIMENAEVAGQIGISIDCNNSTIAAGINRQLATLQFTVAENAQNGTTALTFNDATAKRSVSSNPASGLIKSVPTTFTDGLLNISSNRKFISKVSTIENTIINGANVFSSNDGFNAVGFGEVYTENLGYKGYQFNPRLVESGDTDENLNFMARL